MVASVDQSKQRITLDQEWVEDQQEHFRTVEEQDNSKTRDLHPKTSMLRAPVFILVKVAKTLTPLGCTQTKETHLKIVYKDKDQIKTETQAPSLQLEGS